ncbi:11728_t:CDS:10 [Paraglomus brasilianum]|uniref:11728_t:CDS:1 n=1 Tax=Paraglomus brasilianum TaxID=144538 RepID=A0A9N9AZ90_9GLOM|nr:11728_t:CDS:10 [Paraglomus brasilianum]
MSVQSSNYSTNGNAEAATGPSASENTGAFQSVKTYLSNKDYKFYLCLSATAVLVGAGVYYFSSSPKSKKKKRPPKRRHQGTGVKKSEPRSAKNKEDVVEYEKFTPEQIEALPMEKRIDAAQTLKERGNRAFGAKRYGKAIDLYTSALAFNKDSIYYSNRAACYFHTQQYENTINDCNEALVIDKHYIKALNRRASAYEFTKQNRTALNDYTASCIMDNFRNESSAEAIERLSKLVAQEEAHEMMRDRPSRLPSTKYVARYFDAYGIDKRRRADGGTNGEITSDSENKGEEYYEKAMQHVRQHRWQEAMEAFDKAIELGCSHMAEAYEYRGSFHFLCASTDKALADLNKALELKPDFTRAHLKKATIYMEQNNGEEANSEFETAIRKDPNNADIYYHRGQVNFVTNKLEDAIKDYEKSIQLYDKYLYTHVQLGLAKYRLGFIEEGYSILEKCLEKFGESSDIHNFLGELCYDLQRFDEALANFEKAISLGADDAAPYVNKALLCLQKQDPAQAEEFCHKALEIDPESDVALNAMSQILHTQNKVEEALTYMKRAVDLARTEEELAAALQYVEIAKAQLEFQRNYPERANELSMRR